jgi:hypothetical protein
LGAQKVETPKISRQSAHEGDKVVSLKRRPSLLPREDLACSFMLQAESKLGT